MNDYSEILETQGEYRVSIVPDPHAEPPDWDGQGTIVMLDTGYTGRAYVQHPSNGDDFGLAYLWEHWRDMELVERYLRMFHGVVGFDYFDDCTQTRGAKYVCIVTETDLREWGFMNLRDWANAAKKHDMDPNPAVGNLNAWQHWVDGEVYGYRIEQRVQRETTTRSITGDLIRTSASTGWDEVESVWGYYGEDDAREQALEAFNDYLTREGVPA